MIDFEDSKTINRISHYFIRQEGYPVTFTSIYKGLVDINDTDYKDLEFDNNKFFYRGNAINHSIKMVNPTDLKDMKISFSLIEEETSPAFNEQYEPGFLISTHNKKGYLVTGDINGEPKRVEQMTVSYTALKEEVEIPYATKKHLGKRELFLILYSVLIEKATDTIKVIPSWQAVNLQVLDDYSAKINFSANNTEPNFSDLVVKITFSEPIAHLLSEWYPH